MRIALRLFAPWLLTLAFAGCAAETVEPAAAEPAAGETAAATEALIIAEVDLPSGQQVVFVETDVDEISVRELGALGAKPILTSYKWTGGGGPLPADRRGRQPRGHCQARACGPGGGASRTVQRARRDPLEEPSEGTAPVREDGVGVAKLAVGSVRPSPWANSAQFQAGACSTANFDAGICWLNSWGGDTGYSGDLSRICSSVMHAWNVGTVTHTERKWICTLDLPLGCASGGWRTVDSHTIRAGQYGLFTSTNRRVRYVSKTTTPPSITARPGTTSERRTSVAWKSSASKGARLVPAVIDGQAKLVDLGRAGSGRR